MDEAEEIVTRMNREEICPMCGKQRKFKATSDFDMLNERRIIDGIVNNAVDERWAQPMRLWEVAKS